jgi:hypothetical protein
LAEAIVFGSTGPVSECMGLRCSSFCYGLGDFKSSVRERWEPYFVTEGNGIKSIEELLE